MPGISESAADAASVLDRVASGPRVWLTAGDSVAQGARWTAGARDWAQLLEERVRYELGRSDDVFVRTAASGWRTADVLAGLPAVRRWRPDVVLLGVGLNDAKYGGEGYLPRFRGDFGRLLDQLGAGGATVVVQSPNRVRPEADAILIHWLPAYAAAIVETAADRGVAIVDHYGAWGVRGRWAPAEWMADPIHPSGTGHRVMARTLFTACGLWDPASECCRLTIPVDRAANGGGVAATTITPGSAIR